jgi:hypothetical protein
VKKLLAVLFAASLAISGLPVLAQATQTQPDSMAVLSAHAFTNLVETGDVSIVFRWKIDYPSSYTSDNYNALNPAAIAILFNMYATDGTTLLRTTTPYVYAPFLTNGYEQGISSFYFPASENLTVDQGYFIQIAENPTYFASANTTSYTMTGTDWADDTEADMKTWILTQCDYLLAEYPTVILKTATDVGLVFSTYGESYFRAAVPGIQTLCPALFYVQDFTPEEMPVSYDSTLQDQYSIRMQGSEIKRGADRIGASFGLTGYAVLGFAVLGMCIASGVVTMKKGWGLEPGMIGASIIGVGGAVLLGNAIFTIVMIGTLIGAMALMFTFVGRRA